MAMMDFFDFISEYFGEIIDDLKAMAFEKEEKAISMKERDLGETIYKPKWKIYIRDRRLKIHRIRSTL